jgi:hypothetical protein
LTILYLSLRQFFDNQKRCLRNRNGKHVMSKIFLKIEDLRVENPVEGIILGIVSLEEVTSGWVVKMAFGQNLVGQDGIHQAVKIASITTLTIAGYKDGKTELWDVVEIFDKEDEATEAAKQFGQMTIYQIETATLKWIN